jgi:hypothetical protein
MKIGAVRGGIGAKAGSRDEVGDGGVHPVDTAYHKHPKPGNRDHGEFAQRIGCPFGTQRDSRNGNRSRAIWSLPRLLVCHRRFRSETALTARFLLPAGPDSGNSTQTVALDSVGFDPVQFLRTGAAMPIGWDTSDSCSPAVYSCSPAVYSCSPAVCGSVALTSIRLIGI